MNRPTAYPFWTDGASPSKVVAPDGATALQGFVAGEPPPFQYVNFLFWLLGSWVQYLDQITATGLNNALIRLINGGNWSFNASTGALSWSANANLAIPSIPDSSNLINAGFVTLSDGEVAYCTANMPTSSQGDTNSITFPDEIVNMNFTGNISVGMNVTGPGIPIGTTVLGVAPNSVLLSQNVTSNNTGATYVFSASGPITIHTAANTALIPSVNTILIARRAGNFVYLGVNCAQMVLRDGEFKTLVGTGYFSVYQANAGMNLTRGTLCYISPGPADGGRTSGALYPLDVSAANQAVRGTYAGVVITDVTTGNPATLLYSGFFTEVSVVAGENYYADPMNPGGITNSEPAGAGDKITPVGFAVTSTALLFTGVSANIAGPSAFPIWKEEFLTDTGDHQHYTMSATPMADQTIFIFTDGQILYDTEWSRSSLTINFGSPQAPDFTPYARYILASQNFLSAFQELASNPSGDKKTYVLSSNPDNQLSTFVWVDRGIVESSEWSLQIGGGQSKIVFNSALAQGQSENVYVGYFSSAAGGGGGGGIGGATNLGGGHGVFKQVSAGIAQFKTLVAGSGTTLTEDASTITVSLSGGGAPPENHGSIGSPIAIDPTMGIVPTSAGIQVWFATTQTLAAGASPITAVPQIAAGMTIGQMLIVFGITNGSGGYLRVVNGNGLFQNGDFDLPTGQCLVYIWNGATWQFVSNAI